MPNLSGKVGPPALIESLREMADQWESEAEATPSDWEGAKIRGKQCASDLRALLNGYEAGGGAI